MNHIKTTFLSIALCLFVTTFITASSMADFPKEEILTELQGYGEPDELAEPLSTAGISIRPTTGYDEIYDLYKDYKQNLQPVFITTDILFHTTHKVFDYSLRVIELDQVPLLQNFSKEMYGAAVNLKKEFGKHKHLTEPADQLIAYFAVPNLLLGNSIEIEGPLKEKVNGEIELIKAHKGFGFSKILQQKEDYSQYAVRGHYTRNEELRKYFLASLWYGRRMFRFDESEPGGAGNPPDTPNIKGWWKKGNKEVHDIAQSEILSGCLLVYLLENTSVGNEQAIEIYKRLKSPYDFLVGRSEDITIEILSDALRKTFGKKWNPADLGDSKKLLNMAKTVAEGNTVRIDSTGMGRKGLTLFGQRFILDSAFFQKLVHDKDNQLPYIGKGPVKEKPFTWVRDQIYGEVRGFPRGLDLMAILGSEEAEKILKEKGDADYRGYEKNLDSLKQEYRHLSLSDSVYEKMLGAFAPLFGTDSKAPEFMHSGMWKRKSLNTALGAWTELRHDTILYGKQSYTSVPKGGTGPKLESAYLEPNPQVYERLASILSDLDNPGKISVPDYLSKKYKSLISICNRLVQISGYELKGTLPATKDADFLVSLGDRLKRLTELPRDIAEEIVGKADSQMPIVADVHTRMPQALTEAVGFPAKIIVVIPVGKKPMLFFGGVYSYYEFKVHYENRLTDEKWMKELKSEKVKFKPLFF